MDDLAFMREAHREALLAYDAGEYPVGAVVVRDGEILAAAHNTVKAEHDPTAHAEIRSIRAACARLEREKLPDCTLYTTLYPCPMCDGVIREVGIRRVVYGGSAFPWVEEVKFAIEVERVGPIREDECRGLFERRLRENGRTDILDYRAK